MSVLEEIRTLEKQVLARLRELEPMQLEYRELRQVAERMGLDYQPPGDSQAGPRSRPQRRARAPSKRAPERAQRRGGTRRSKSAGRRQPVAAGQRDQQVLSAVGERPGITVPELGQALNVDYTGLYRVVKRLEGQGKLRKSGPQLELATGSS